MTIGWHGRHLLTNPLHCCLVCHSCVAIEHNMVNMACLIVCFVSGQCSLHGNLSLHGDLGDIVVTAGQLALECQVPAAKTARGAKSGQTL